MRTLAKGKHWTNDVGSMFLVVFVWRDNSLDVEVA
jgi:hypothetical protein